MALFKISKGKSTNLPANKVNGYCYVTTDEHKLYVDYTKDDGTLDRFALNATYADTAGSVSKLGTENVGNSNKPIYLEDGTPKECVDFLPLSAGEDKKLTGPLGLTENVNYGPSLPDYGFVGQLFFVEEEDKPSLPEGGTAGQVLVKNSSTDGDASWATDISGNAATATKLASAKTICTNLASNSAASFDGSTNITPGVTGILGVGNGGTGATTAAEARTNLGAVNMVTTTVTLSASSWSSNAQTVNVSGVTSSNTILVSYNPESYEAYSDAAIRCIGQNNGILTFSCDSIPSVNVSVNVVILN